MPEHYILGIDTGGTMARAAVFDMDGTEVASARHANNLRYPEPGHTEVDAEEVWCSACHAVRKVPEVSGIRPDEVLGVSTTRSDGTRIGPSSRALRPSCMRSRQGSRSTMSIEGNRAGLNAVPRSRRPGP